MIPRHRQRGGLRHFMRAMTDLLQSHIIIENHIITMNTASCHAPISAASQHCSQPQKPAPTHRHLAKAWQAARRLQADCTQKTRLTDRETYNIVTRVDTITLSRLWMCDSQIGTAGGNRCAIRQKGGAMLTTQTPCGTMRCLHMLQVHPRPRASAVNFKVDAP